MVVLYLILPLVFYSLVTGVIALTLPLQALMCTLLGAAVTFPVQNHHQSLTSLYLY